MRFDPLWLGRRGEPEERDLGADHVRQRSRPNEHMVHDLDRHRSGDTRGAQPGPGGDDQCVEGPDVLVGQPPEAIRRCAAFAEREPAVRTVLDRIGGITSQRDELWQRMLRCEVTERDYWAQRATELGAALGETWDTRAMIERLYELPQREWLRADVVALMTDTRRRGLRLGALTNDMAKFHGQEWVDRQEYLKLFDVFIDASVTGVLKPDPRAFRSAADALGLPPGQIVFLDDMPGNVEGARAVGMTAIRVPWDDPAPAIDVARDLLGLPARHARAHRDST